MKKVLLFLSLLVSPLIMLFCNNLQNNQTSQLNENLTSNSIEVDDVDARYISDKNTTKGLFDFSYDGNYNATILRVKPAEGFDYFMSSDLTFGDDGKFFYTLEGKTTPTMFTIVKIADQAFMEMAGCHGLTDSITIPTTITSIGKSAFENCSELKTVILKEDSLLKTIGDRAFYNCNSMSFNEFGEFLPNLNTIGNYAFYNCNSWTNKRLVFFIPSLVVSIGDYAFFNCALLSNTLLIYQRTETIGKLAFYNSGFSIVKISFDSVYKKRIKLFAFSNMPNLTEIALQKVNIFNDFLTMATTISSKNKLIPNYMVASIIYEEDKDPEQFEVNKNDHTLVVFTSCTSSDVLRIRNEWKTEELWDLNGNPYGELRTKDIVYLEDTTQVRVSASNISYIGEYITQNIDVKVNESINPTMSLLGKIKDVDNDIVLISGLTFFPIGVLPNGVAFNQTNGVIEGNPTQTIKETMIGVEILYFDAVLTIPNFIKIHISGNYELSINEHVTTAYVEDKLQMSATQKNIDETPVVYSKITWSVKQTDISYISFPNGNETVDPHEVVWVKIEKLPPDKHLITLIASTTLGIDFINFNVEVTQHNLVWVGIMLGLIFAIILFIIIGGSIYGARSHVKNEFKKQQMQKITLKSADEIKTLKQAKNSTLENKSINKVDKKPKTKTKKS